MSTHSAHHSTSKRLDEFNKSYEEEEEESSREVQDSQTVQTGKTNQDSLREAIIDLSSDEIDHYDTNQYEKERDKLEQLSLLNIIEYIKSSIEILMNMKLDENEGKSSQDHIPNSKPYFKKDVSHNLIETGKSYPSDFEPPKEYEHIIQKLEADIRTHIRVEQQLKLHIETVHSKMEEMENKLSQYEIKCSELENSIRIEQVLHAEKSLKYEQLEQKLQELEKKHQKEVKFMQREIKRIKENDETQINQFNNISSGEHLNTYTQRKLIQGDQMDMKNQPNITPISYKNGIHNSSKINAINQQLNSHKIFHGNHKGLSTSSNSISNNITLPGSHSTKKANQGIRKIENDMQKNLIKGFIMNKTDNENNGTMLELSSRTPDKSNPEMSPYMLEFYMKKKTLYDETFASKVRTSGGSMKPFIKANIERTEDHYSPERSNDSTTHK